MSKERFAAARELLQQGKYKEARALLATIEHPKSEEWIAKIDERLAKRKKSPPKRWRNILLAVVVTLVAGVAAFYFFYIVPASESGRASARMFIYCLEVYGAIDNTDGMSGCSDWTDSVYPVYRDEVLACHRLSPDLDTPFNECLINEEILPPGVVLR